MTRRKLSMRGLKNHWLNHAVVFGPKLTLCTTEPMFLKQHAALSKEPPPHWIHEGHAAVHTYDGESNMIVVTCIEGTGRSGIEIAALIAHEAVHVKQRFMSFIGEKEPSDEFEAYTVQNITQNLLEEYARQMKLLSV